MIDPSKASGALRRAPRPLADKDRLRQAVGACGLGLWELHVADGLCHLDHEAAALLGLPPDASLLPTARLLSLVHESDVAALKEAILALLDSGCECAHEFRVRRSDGGDVRWLAFKSCILDRGDEGEVVVVAGVLFDVTARRYEQEAKELLNQELAHRMKNMLSVIGSIVTMSGEHRPEARDFVTALQARLSSLAPTHALLTKSEGGRSPLAS
jgi:two-component sensor histidine kinase